ncbi:hypothetical protein C0995_008095, partial [Termitomyces sp. Mi166
WSARMDAAMDEAARQTERARSRAGSTPHQLNDGHCDTSGWESQGTIGDKDPDRSLGRTPFPVSNIRRGEHSQSRRYSESSREAEEAADHRSSVTSGRTTASRSHEEELELERERRSQEIFERMRRVLDNSSDGSDPFADGVGSESNVSVYEC